MNMILKNHNMMEVSVVQVMRGLSNGLISIQCQAITWTNADLLLIGPLETNFSEILIEIHTF